MKKSIEIINWSSPLPKPIQAFLCKSFFCRLKGLMFRKHIPENSGLLFIQTNENRIDASIHMFFVYTDLTVVWINKGGAVVDIILAKSWHPAYFPSTPAKYILELSPQHLNDFKIGDQIKFE